MLAPYDPSGSHQQQGLDVQMVFPESWEACAPLHADKMLYAPQRKQKTVPGLENLQSGNDKWIKQRGSSRGGRRSRQTSCL